MHLRTNIKMGEVNNLSDARYAASIGAGFIGFRMSPAHPQYIAPEKVKEILGWIEGAKAVAEWENEPTEVIVDTCERLNIGYAQLNQCNAECSSELGHLSLIQNFTIDHNLSMPQLIDEIDKIQKFTKYYMLSFDDLETQEYYLEKPAHQLMLLDICRDYPVILNFQFNKDNLLPILDAYEPFGINLRGGNEDKPGIKDFDTLNELVEMITND